MPSFNFEQVIKRFLLSEGKNEPSLKSYLRALDESLKNFPQRTGSDKQRVEMALEALRGVRRHARRLHERTTKLEEDNKIMSEQLSLLEESGEK